MRKRPLFTAAFLLAFVIWLLTGVFGMDFFPEKLKSGSRVVLSGQVRSFEEKGERIYLYLTHVECRDPEEVEDNKKSNSGDAKSQSYAVEEKKESNAGEENKKNNAEEEIKQSSTEVEKKQSGAGEERVSFRKVLLTADPNKISGVTIRPGVTIRAEAECTGFRIARNDGNYDEKSYYHSLGVAEKFQLKGDIRITDPSYDPLRTALQWLRGKLLRTITELAVSEHSSATGTAADGGDKKSSTTWQKKDSAETADGEEKKSSITWQKEDSAETADAGEKQSSTTWQKKDSAETADGGEKKSSFAWQKENSAETENGREKRGSTTWLQNDSAETADGGHAGIFAAIITGDRSGLDAETKEMYQKSGIAHILAISGLHISLLGMSLFSILRKRMRFLFAAILSGIIMVFFCIMSGESASAVRATLMFLLRLFAMKTGKTFDLLSALGFSAICLLLHNPMILYHSGFLMSFGAILGIGLLAPAIENYLKENRYLFKANPDFVEEQSLFDMIFGGADLKEKLLASLLASASVTLITIPVIMNSYYQVPLLSVFFNLLVVPLMGLILQSGVFSAFVGIISIFLGRLVIGIGVYLVSLIELLCALIDKIPFSIIITGHMPAYRIALYYGVLILFMLMAAHRKRRTHLIVREPADYSPKGAGEIFRNIRQLITYRPKGAGRILHNAGQEYDCRSKGEGGILRNSGKLCGHGSNELEPHFQNDGRSFDHDSSDSETVFQNGGQFYDISSKESGTIIYNSGQRYDCSSEEERIHQNHGVFCGHGSNESGPVFQNAGRSYNYESRESGTIFHNSHQSFVHDSGNAETVFQNGGQINDNSSKELGTIIYSNGQEYVCSSKGKGQTLRNPRLFFRKQNRQRRRRLAVTGLFLTVLCIIVFFHPAPSNLKITFFDVDQGESILLESPGGEVYLIDGGSSSVTELYRYRLKGALKYRGISEIDRVIITHPDTDHISGILSMLRESGADSIRVSKLLIPEVKGNEKYEELLVTAEDAGVACGTLKAGMVIGDERLSLRCLHPDADFHSNEANGYSAVLDLTYGNFRALFTGDLGAEEEKLLLNKHALADYDLLKVAHHGSKHSSAKEFLKTVSPEIAIISAGVHNSYGHPHKEVVERLRAVGSDIYVTNEKGEIFVTAYEDGTVSVQTKLCA